MPNRWKAYYKCSYCNKEYTTDHLLNADKDGQKDRYCPCCGTYNTPKTICECLHLYNEMVKFGHSFRNLICFQYLFYSWR